MDYDSILVLAQESDLAEGGSLDTDSNSISTLILIRDIQSEMVEKEAAARERSLSSLSEGGPSLSHSDTSAEWSHHFHRHVNKVSVVAEILDSETKKLMNVTSNFGAESIMSNELISMYISMVAEQQEVNIVLQELMSAYGAGLDLVPIEAYLDLKREPKLDCWTLMGRARLRPLPEIILGYYRPGRADNHNPIVINPTGCEEDKKRGIRSKKSPIEWRPGDKLIVIRNQKILATSPCGRHRLDRADTLTRLATWSC